MPPLAFLSTFPGPRLASPPSRKCATRAYPLSPPPLRHATMLSAPVDEFSVDLWRAARSAASALRGCPVYFVGAMGSGKSAAAAYAAHALGYRFVDTDVVAAAAAGKDVAAVFADEGEDAFRDLESAVLNEVQAWRRTAVATGGGAVLRDENWACMRTGVVVWLDVEVGVLARRLEGDGTRPLLGGLEGEERVRRIAGIVEERRVRYELADVRVPVEGEEAVDEVVRDVLGRVADFIKENPPRFKEAQDELYPEDGRGRAM